MGKAESYRDLIVWQKSMDLAVTVYRHASGLPAHERYCLTQQLTRAAVSVAANIAEGNARGTVKDYAHFISIARGSLAETETYLLLIVRLEHSTAEAIQPLQSLCCEIDKMLFALRQRLLTGAGAGKSE